MVVQPVSSIARGRGRPTNDDAEAATPAGRWLHRLEGHVYGIALACVRGREQLSAWTGHDALTDASVRANEAIGCELLKHDDPVVRAWGALVLGNCADYYRHDTNEDACTAGLFGIVAEIHEAAKRIAGWIERSCAQIRGGHR